jgi:hypothetical protein
LIRSSKDQRRATFEVLPCPEEFCGGIAALSGRGFSWLAILRKWGFGRGLAMIWGRGENDPTLAFLLHEKAEGRK